MYGEIIDRAKACLKEKRPFVVYSKPWEKEVCAIFQNDGSLYELTDYTETGFVFAPFSNNRPTVLLRPHLFLRANKPQRIGNKGKKAIQECNADGGAHKEMIRMAIDAIGQGRLQKVVLSKQFKIDVAVGATNIFEKLAQLYPSAFCYLWHHPKVGLWLGATPEILLAARGNRLTTMSLAGTLPVLKGKEPQWGKKEIMEQEMVTDYVKSALAKYVADLQVAPLETVRAGTLWHLRTKLTGQFNVPDFGQVLRALHPTPAVCGIPLPEAMDFIGKNEGYPREYYTGYLGELNIKGPNLGNTAGKSVEDRDFSSVNTVSNLYVNLRCMQLKAKKGHVYVGGGITKDSDPQREWEEICNKGTTILRALV